MKGNTVMPTIKIENKSDDDIIICFEGEEKELADGESVFFENRQKGVYSVRVHRKRVPRETVIASEAPQGLEAAKAADEKPGSHVQLDSVIEFEVNSSKAAVTVIQDIKGVETLHEDVIFVGYRAELAGAKAVSKKDYFANSGIKRMYISQQIKSAFLPVGLVGILIFLVGAVFSIMNLGGYIVRFLSGEVSLKRSLLLLAGGFLVTAYFIVNVFQIIRRARSLTEKSSADTEKNKK